ncbi:MAG: DNRLRE domain-containing protein [Planctomycetota bacterium]
MSPNTLVCILCVAALLTGSAQATTVLPAPGLVRMTMDDGDGHDTYASTYGHLGNDLTHGNSESVWVGKAGDWRHNAYFKFDQLPDLALPPGRVVSAALWLCVGKLEQPGSTADVVILGHRVLEPWTERTDGGMTGNSQPAVEAGWTFRTAETPSLGFRSYDVTGLVRDWLAEPESNCGVRLSHEYDVEQTYYFVSSEAHGPYPEWPYHSPENRPYLEITYAMHEPSACAMLLLGSAILAARKRRTA